MNARLVYDGGTLIVPPELGTPAPNQLRGTDADNLAELASRVCYDSLGVDASGKPRGRSSEKLHEHIREVKHLSVYEHVTMTVVVPTHGFDLTAMLLATRNRKGIWVEVYDSGDAVGLTVNMRAVLEWDRYSPSSPGKHYAAALGNLLRSTAHQHAPLVVPRDVAADVYPAGVFVKTDDLTDDQAHITLYLAFSRGASHEQVRHRYAVSQRSTRYVDESESPYIEHPLVTRFLADPSVSKHRKWDVEVRVAESVGADRESYDVVVDHLETYLAANGADKLTARKQARGAARGYLGNALGTEMLFSASVAGWQDMIRQRLSAFPDAEIRHVYALALDALKSSRYGDRFAGFTTVPSPDGIGVVLATAEGA